MAIPSLVAALDSFIVWREATNTVISNMLDKTLNLSDVPDAAAARVNLGLELGVDIPVYLQNNWSGTAAPGATDDSDAGYDIGSAWIDTSAEGQNEVWRCINATIGSAVWVNTSLELDDLGSIATQDANAVAITGGSVTGITDLAVADGGTGASDIATARTNLDVHSKAESLAEAEDLAIAMAIALG